MNKVAFLSPASYRGLTGLRLVRTINMNDQTPRQAFKCSFDGRGINRSGIAELSLERTMTALKHSNYRLTNPCWDPIQVQNLSFIFDLRTGRLKGEQFLQMPERGDELGKGIKSVLEEFTLGKDKSPVLPHIEGDKVAMALAVNFGLIVLKDFKGYDGTVFAMELTKSNMRWTSKGIETAITANPRIKSAAGAEEIFNALLAIRAKILKAK